MKIRIKFRKWGSTKFIGHLDVMRFFQKGLRRADIDVAYSSGFSPHQIMSFASPLGVGLESNGEYFDVEILTPISSQEFIDKFNSRIQRYQKEGKSIPKVMQQYIEKYNTKYNNMLLEKGGSSHYNTMYHNFLRENASSFGIKYETNFSNLV